MCFVVNHVYVTRTYGAHSYILITTTVADAASQPIASCALNGFNGQCATRLVNIGVTHFSIGPGQARPSELCCAVHLRTEREKRDIKHFITTIVYYCVYAAAEKTRKFIIKISLFWLSFYMCVIALKYNTRRWRRLCVPFFLIYTHQTQGNLCNFYP